MNTEIKNAIKNGNEKELAELTKGMNKTEKLAIVEDGLFYIPEEARLDLVVDFFSESLELDRGQIESII